MEKVKRKKLGKRILGVVLSVALVLGLMPGNVEKVSAATVTIPNGYVGHNIEESSITINQAGKYYIYGTNTAVDNGITVSGDIDVEIIIHNVSIKRQESVVNAAMKLENGANVILKLSGSNEMRPGGYKAPINVPAGTTLTITSVDGNNSTTGSLKTRAIRNQLGYGASGIGADGVPLADYGVADRAPTCGSIIINGGTVESRGSSGGAGIGGSSWGTVGSITINGGYVKAIAETDSSSSGGGAAIGGGYTGKVETITITGGTVVAQKDGVNDSAAIGAGEPTFYINTGLQYLDSIGNITITGGDITANGNIGASPDMECKNGTVTIKYGANLNITNGTISDSTGTIEYMDYAAEVSIYDERIQGNENATFSIVYNGETVIQKEVTLNGESGSGTFEVTFFKKKELLDRTMTLKVVIGDDIYQKEITLKQDASYVIDNRLMVFNVSYGDVTISQSGETYTVTYTDSEGVSHTTSTYGEQQIPFTKDTPYVITGTARDNYIRFNADLNNVTLKDCNMTVYALNIGIIEIMAQKEVHLNLVGNNILSGQTYYKKLINLYPGASLNIYGPGKLKFSSPNSFNISGICYEGYDEMSSPRKLTINGGQIQDINTSRQYTLIDQKIDLIINGGTIYSPYGEMKAESNCINGGTVDVRVINGTISNNENEVVSKRELVLEGVTESVKVEAVEGLEGYGITDVYTTEEGKLYFYLSETTPNPASITAGGVTYDYIGGNLYSTRQHEHAWEYSVQDGTTNVLGKHCTEDGCGYTDGNAGTMTLTTTADSYFYEEGVAITDAVVVTYSADWEGVRNHQVVYEGNAQPGIARGSVTINGVTIYVEFEIIGFTDSDDDGYYEIANIHQLYWFAEYVKEGNPTACAELTADIDFSEWDFAAKPWTPIGQTASFHASGAEVTDTGYSGTFNGNGYTITGLTVTGVSGGIYSYGLFGTVSGTIKNLGMVNFVYTMGNAGDTRAGSVAGQLLTGGTITNCYSVGHSITTNDNIAGGIAGCNYGGTVSNCYAYNGIVTGHGDRWGGVVGDCQDDGGADAGVVTNCYTDDIRVVSAQNTIANITYCGVKNAEAFASGEVAHLLNGSQSENVTWYQTLGAEAQEYPTLIGTGIVYCGYDKCKAVYANTRLDLATESEKHEWSDGICSYCEKECEHPSIENEICKICLKYMGLTVKPYDGGSALTEEEYVVANNVHTIKTDRPIIISGITTSQRIVVASGVNANIIFNGVDIDVSSTNNACAFKIEDNSMGNVTITLADRKRNYLKSGKLCAGLQKNGDTSTGTLIIQGGEKGTGTLTATGGERGAGIGGRIIQPSSNIIISGGTVTANGGDDGSGIGGGSSYAGTNITISGGVVIATGGERGAGIGGGNGGTGTGITIEGGTVTATGGERGAGIGGGYNGAGNNITIKDGTVTATGDNGGAGIGGGYSGAGNNITIEGGIVTATGGETDFVSGGGSGIGGGNGGAGTGISIEGGTVTARSNGYGAGIGGGYNEEGSNIIISGGSVKAIAGTNANAIGGGQYQAAVTPTDGNGNHVSLQELRFDGVTTDGLAVSAVTGVTYGIKDVKTMDSGKLYFYLPADTMPVMITAGDVTYCCEKDNIYYAEHSDSGKDGYCDKCSRMADGISALAGHSVTLGDNIGMKFYMELDSSVLNDSTAYMQFTLPGKDPVQVMVSSVGEPVVEYGKTCYVFTYEVAAKEMADTITAQMFCSDGNGGTRAGTAYEYSVKQYAEALLGGNTATDAQKKLAKAMLNYGAYAQLYFGYNTNNLANAGNADNELAVTKSELQSFKPVVTGENETFTYAGSTLILEADVKVRHYFKLKEGQEYTGSGLTLYAAQPGDNLTGTYYYWESAGITAAKLGDMVDYTGVNGITINYCPLSYVTTAVVNTDTTLTEDTKLQNLLKALYLYYQATK